MSWFGTYQGSSFFGGWWASVVQYLGRAKRGFSYAVRAVRESFVSVKANEKSVKTRGQN